MSFPIVLLRLEGLALALVAGFVLYRLGLPWYWVVALVAWPDVSMIGYLAGPRIGAIVYNAAHNEVLPLLLLAYGLVDNGLFASAIAAGWLVHIGIDRAVGYGLKELSGFNDTHLGRIGRPI